MISRFVISSGRLIAAALYLLATADGQEHVVSVTRQTQQEQQTTTIADVLQDDTSYQSFVKGLDAAGLLGDLSGPGPFTIFAPTNSALALIPDGYFMTLTKDPAYLIHLQNLLAFHVDIEAPFQAADLTDGRELLMANEEYLTVTDNGGIIELGNSDGASATVLVPDDYVVSNGVVHQLDEALLPKFVFTNVYNETGVFFQNLLVTAGLEDLLMSGDFTVIVPSNEAFVGVPSDVFADVDQLTEILQYHIFDKVLPPQQLKNGQYKTVNGESMVVTASDDGRAVTFDGIPVQSLTLANNGLVYSIDAVLFPGQDIPTFAPQPTSDPDTSMEPTMADQQQPTIPSSAEPTIADEASSPSGEPNLADIVQEADDLKSISLALQSSNLMEQVQNIGAATIFAPIDNAFLQVNQELMSQLFQEEWIAHLQNLLALHTLSPDVLYAADLTDGASVTTLSGEDLTIDIGDGGSVFVNGPDGTGGVVTTADVAASNGVLHKIDSLLLPSWIGEDLLSIGSEISEISTFMGLIASTGLDQTVATGLFTLLAPSDDAFSESMTNSSSSDELIKVLQYHMIPRLAPTALLANSTLETLEGRNILVSYVPGQRVMFNDATALFVDIPANNGLIFVIDKVLEIEDYTAAPAAAPVSSSSPPLTESPSPVASPASPTSATSSIPPTDSADQSSDGARHGRWTVPALCACTMIAFAL